MDRDYRLDDLDTTQPDLVASEIESIHGSIFPGGDPSRIRGYIHDVRDMFEGRYKDYQAMDTSYHDLEHTMQASLCFVRLMASRQLESVLPPMTEEAFEVGLVSILMHDVGYLKKRDDGEGTGAKFTFVHEMRSCEFADVFLSERGWPLENIHSVRHLISCTGPRAIIDAIPFRSEIDRVMGEAVCTADYLGQMSDPKYVSKLPVLFNEFEESDDFRGIPRDERLFKGYDQLLRGTPYFWEKIVVPKMENECSGLMYFLSHPFPHGRNPYIERIEQNMGIVKDMIAEADRANEKTG